MASLRNEGLKYFLGVLKSIPFACDLCDFYPVCMTWKCVMGNPRTVYCRETVLYYVGKYLKIGRHSYEMSRFGLTLYGHYPN